MKHFLLPIIVALLCSCASEPGFDLAMARLDGKGIPDKCNVYAENLNHELHSKGVESRIVEVIHQQPVKVSGRNVLGHVFVLYRENGKLWATDNMQPHPVQIPDTGSDRDKAVFFLENVGVDSFNIATVNTR